MSAHRDETPGGVDDTRRAMRDLLINAYLDGDLDGPGEALLRESFESDPGAWEELARAQFALARLREAEAHPDVSGRVLDQLGCVGAVLPTPVRRGVRIKRFAAAAALLALVGGAALWQRMNPGLAADLAGRADLIGEVADAGSQDLSRVADRLDSTRQQLTVTASVMPVLGQGGAASAARIGAFAAACNGPCPEGNPETRGCEARDTGELSFSFILIPTTLGSAVPLELDSGIHVRAIRVLPPAIPDKLVP